MAKKNDTTANATTVPDVIPAQLSWRKLIYPTNATFFSVSDDGVETPIKKQTGTFLGTTSHRSAKEEDKHKMNPKTVEYATLNPNDSILRIKFWADIIPLNRKSFVFLTADFWKNFSMNLNDYKNTYKFEELAFRYVSNLVNLRWAFHNVTFATDKSVTIKVLEGRNEVAYEHTFDNDFLVANVEALRDFTYDCKSDADMSVLVNYFKEVLGNDKPLLRVEVSCDLCLSQGANIHPSQLFPTLFGDKAPKEESAKQLFENALGVAFTPFKVGNAIRTIDTWYTDYTTNQTVLPINPYGQERDLVCVWRDNTNMKDFFNLLAEMLKNGVNTMSAEDLHFIFANFIRGGVAG